MVHGNIFKKLPLLPLGFNIKYAVDLKTFFVNFMDLQNRRVVAV